jgi:TRAP transporter TAXI family solute receptor
MQRRTLLAATLGAAVGGAARGAGATTLAQEQRFFRIGTGGVAGVYFPIGGLIASAISNPPGSRLCAEAESCGVPGLIATAIASNGSVANVGAVAAGSLDSGFSQSDIAYWAWAGAGVFEGRPKVEILRAIANLYPEAIHLVARRGAGIRGVRDLRGKRVSLDEPGSGTLVAARTILAAFGVNERDLRGDYVKPAQAAEKLAEGALDAFFFVGGAPTPAISELAAAGTGIELVPIDGPEAARLLADHRFFTAEAIAAGTYPNVAETRTISVNAIWITSMRIDAELVYGVTRALWNDNTRRLLDSGHPKGRAIQLRTALDGVAIPLHPGAERFYREAGVLK